MAEFRTIHSKMWRDSWYAELDVDGKLLWVYLITNGAASLTGIYHLPVRIAAFETGMSQERVSTLLAKFVLAGKIEYENEIIWIRRMRKYQAKNETSPKVLPRILKDLDEIPDCKVKNLYLNQYPISTVLSLGPTDTDTDTDQETEKDQETEIIGAPAPTDKPKPDKSKLRFDVTPKGALMAQKLRAVYESKGHRPPEFYANALQRDAYLIAFSALGGNLERLLNSAMKKDIVERGKLLAWLEGCAKNNGGNGKNPDENKFDRATAKTLELLRNRQNGN
jgi:hypothetical protein